MGEVNPDEGSARRLAERTLNYVEGLTEWQARQVEVQTKLANALLEALDELRIERKIVYDLDKRVEELEEALRFYANEDNYMYDDPNVSSAGIPSLHEDEGGAIARAALAKGGGGVDE